LGGCGPQRPETVRVSGRVLCNGQPLPKPGVVYFAPVEAAEGFTLRPGKGEFDERGYFSATTWESGDGLMPGRYKVAFDCWERPPSAEGPPPKNHVPQRYREPAESPIELTVAAGSGPLDVEWDLGGEAP
jgi:hypothetical protein